MNWIPITESQPKDGEMVLFVQTRDGGQSVECGQRYGGASEATWGVAYDMYEGDSWGESHVTHWMPLPDPPVSIPPSPENPE